jgi:hypothetical protein
MHIEKNYSAEMLDGVPLLWGMRNNPPLDIRLGYCVDGGDAFFATRLTQRRPRESFGFTIAVAAR